MGHLLFCILHFIAMLLSFILLFITIPLHLIYSACEGPKPLRYDGQKATRGLFGGIWDYVAEANQKQHEQLDKKAKKKMIFI